MSWWAAGEGVELTRGGWSFLIPGYDARFSEEQREELIDAGIRRNRRHGDDSACAARVTPRPGSDISITDWQRTLKCSTRLRGVNRARGI